MTARERLQKKQEELFHTAKKSLGQNFLVSDQVIAKIIQATEDQSPRKLIEIGPGLGALTDLLVEKFGPYQCIELDNSLATYWKNQGMNVIHEDALKTDWKKIDFDVLVSNLPYQISSSIVIDRSIDIHQGQSMILMFQKEVAQRIRAICKTEHYGMLSVVAQEFWNIQTVCDAGPRDFYPPPKVASRVLLFKQKKSEIQNKEKYLEFAKLCFTQRRRILKSQIPDKLMNRYIDWLNVNKLTDKVRSEELNPNQLKSLYFHLGFGV